MPVQGVGSKTALLAAVARFAPHLFTNHVTQNPQTRLRAPFFRLIKMVVHQFMEHAHRWVTLKLAGNIALCGLGTFLLLDNLRQHEFRRRTGVLFYTAAQNASHSACLPNC